MKLITKEDFTPQNFVKFSQNIREDQIEPYIYASQANDLMPRVGIEMLHDLRNATSDSRPELWAFLENYVKPFLVLSSYYRFASTHGIHLTQFGMSKTSDPQNTFDQVSGQERAILLRQTASDLQVAETRMLSQPFTFDGVTYVKKEKSNQIGQSIRAPKRKRVILGPFYNYKNGLID
jgi:hypothetical protein